MTAFYLREAPGALQAFSFEQPSLTWQEPLLCFGCLLRCFCGKFLAVA